MSLLSLKHFNIKIHEATAWKQESYARKARKARKAREVLDPPSEIFANTKDEEILRRTFDSLSKKTMSLHSTKLFIIIKTEEATSNLIYRFNDRRRTVALGRHRMRRKTWLP